MTSFPGYSQPLWIVPKQIYLQCSAEIVPCIESLGYTMGKTLGNGTYAKVKAAWSPYEGTMIAIKNLNKRQASEDYLTKFLPREIAILQKVTHPNIISIYQIIETEFRCFFMLEIAQNGDLLDYINARRYLPEQEARFIFTQISWAIGFCHDQDIVHRDLKCENVMLSKNMDVKVGDFGFALDLKTKGSSTPCGSYSYAAPELFTSNGQTYDGKKADIWSMGVILYAMVCGRLPFGDDAQVRRLQSQSRQVNFTKSNLTFECKSFIQSLLNMSIEARPSIHQIMLANWTTAQPNTRPIQLTPANPAYKYKYTVENCLPSFLHHTKSRAACNTLWAQTITIPYPCTQSFKHKVQQKQDKEKPKQEHKQQPQQQKVHASASGVSSSESGKNSAAGYETAELQSLDSSN